MELQTWPGSPPTRASRKYLATRHGRLQQEITTAFGSRRDVPEKLLSLREERSSAPMRVGSGEGGGGRMRKRGPGKSRDEPPACKKVMSRVGRNVGRNVENRCARV